ncbi:putative secreted protein [Sorangium cellulosum So ce56]|uniref:Secreted protein n=1 Tax=Sorangium cellulosum (strain So ce56) TaxID=448385 RepID=A9FHG0_SORC5|nr:putative secreted protein [Sorangium cellulosum So ce56]
MRTHTSSFLTPSSLTRLALLCGAAAAAALSGAACASSAPSPFPSAGGAGGEGGEGGAGGEQAPADPTLGGPCVDDDQCEDGFPCTFDACDTALGRCRFTPDDSACQNDVYCDGVERCNPRLGCVTGAPVACDDQSTCTIDACDEATRTCSSAPRDADLDGDPDEHCGGGDCDDADPTVSSAQPEVCGNDRDDDCDGRTDEGDCVSPEHDTCLDALEISAPGSYAMTTAGAGFHYASSCGLPRPASTHDVVAAVILPPGPPVDVEVTARTEAPDAETEATDVAVTLAGQCGDAATELACGGPHETADGGKLAKLRARGLGDPERATALPLYVTTKAGAPVIVDVAFLPPAPAPENETCGTAAPLSPGAPALATILDAALDLGTACETGLGELVYTFELAEPQDVDLYAISTDGDGDPSLSLRSAACALPEDELACQTAPAPHLFRRALPAGVYAVAVSATAPTSVLVTLELSPPTEPPPDEACEGAAELAPNRTVSVSLLGHQDDVDLGCGPAAVDAVYALELPVASDVLLVEKLSAGDSGAIALSAPACGGEGDRLACGEGNVTPLRSARRNVAPGSYRVVAEAQLGQPVSVTAFVRPAVPPTLVPFSDACEGALEIPESGGFFQGNTANAAADFNAGCDRAGTAEGGARDQLLRLTLTARRRVVLDMAGSSYDTLLSVRRGPGCPGVEMPLSCTIGTDPQRSFLDLVLDPGVYYLQIDGHALAHGLWFLDVRVVDPGDGAGP